MNRSSAQPFGMAATAAAMPVTILAAPAFGYELAAADASTTADQASAARRSLYTWGVVGVVAGAAVNGLITAAAFGAYRRSGSAVGPAFVAGIGSLVVGGGLLLAYSKFISSPAAANTDALAAAMGAHAAL